MEAAAVIVPVVRIRRNMSAIVPRRAARSAAIFVGCGVFGALEIGGGARCRSIRYTRCLSEINYVFDEKGIRETFRTLIIFDSLAQAQSGKEWGEKVGTHNEQCLVLQKGENIFRPIFQLYLER